MKITKKPLLVLAVITTLIASLFLGGCGNSENKGVKPDQSALALYNLVVKHEINAENLPMPEEEAKTFVSTNKTTNKNAIKSMFADLNLSDDVLEDIYKSSLEGNKKVEVKAEVVSEDKDKAVVKLTTTPIDAAAQGKATEDKVAKLNPADLGDPAKLTKAIQDSLKEFSANPVFAKDPKSVEINLVKSDSKWDVSNKEDLQKLITLTNNQ